MITIQGKAGQFVEISASGSNRKATIIGENGKGYLSVYHQGKVTIDCGSHQLSESITASNWNNFRLNEQENIIDCTVK